jgi:hypothetical protein
MSPPESYVLMRFILNGAFGLRTFATLQNVTERSRTCEGVQSVDELKRPAALRPCLIFKFLLDPRGFVGRVINKNRNAYACQLNSFTHLRVPLVLHDRGINIGIKYQLKCPAATLQTRCYETTSSNKCKRS